MCTAITLRSLDRANYMGRTMDFSYGIQPHFYFVPKDYTWKNEVTGEIMHNSYSFIGIGQRIKGDFGFFDGVNEYGFTAAALYFAGYAKYDVPMQNAAKVQIASYDLLTYILGSCKSVEDFCNQTKHIRIIGMTDPVTQTVTPLHWIAADRSGKCVVLEQTENGMELYNNSIGILTNSPDFGWHMTNLRNYMEVTPHQLEETIWGQIKLSPFGQAGGTVLLPGGYTSPERFVRTAYLKTHIPTPDSPENACISFFQVMKSVSLPKGTALTARGTDDYTQYTAFIDTNSREYFFNTYENMQIRKVEFPSSETAPDILVDLGTIAQPVSYEGL